MRPGSYRTGSKSYTLITTSVFWGAMEERLLIEEDLRVRCDLLLEAVGMAGHGDRVVVYMLS